MGSETDIRVLPLKVVNKIAAGEVVERPASVVKELVENAIDAGASRIDIEIVNGGRKLIAVHDNGSGMNKDNALLSLERHATSKIKDVDDIEKIATLGFRGEALAAIASVSRLRLTTCSSGSGGTEIITTGGTIQDVRDIGRPVGTTVEVRDLFFNVPARKKFLRSYQTEQGHIRTGFIVQALACPALGMTLKTDDNLTYSLAGGGNLEDRIRDMFGADYLLSLKQVDYQTSNVKVEGYISVPGLNRADRNEQYVFVNDRSTSASVLSFAVREGYHTVLAKDRHPCVFLFVKTNPENVDVNVHPTKKEVRFREPSEIRDAVIAAVRKALAVSAPAMDDISKKEAGIRIPVPGVQLKIENLPVTRSFKCPRVDFAFNESQAKVRHDDRKLEQVEKEKGCEQEKKTASSSPWEFCRVLGQIGNLYVVMETEDGMVLMDPHASHERVLFERYMGAVTGGKVEMQNLLLPETVELGPKDALRVRKSMGLFRKIGFGISEFGGDAFVVDAMPSYFSGVSAVTLLADIASALEEAGQRGGERQLEEIIAQVACKAAVKAQDKLSLQEIEQLVIDLAQTEMPYTCPHGRPTLIFTSFQELNKKFGRG